MTKKIRVTVDGKPFDVTVEMTDDVPTPASPAPAPVPSAAPPAPAPASSVAVGDVPSPLSGHVVGISVTVGQSVKKGECLVTIEAMKMNTFVLSPSDGKVAAILVKLGDVVQDGHALVRIE
jgi:glutaconyl-CoA/methylmalonyl-CoA decarboxylase subunit gamma